METLLVCLFWFLFLFIGFLGTPNENKKEIILGVAFVTLFFVIGI